ncbi:MAG: PIN domain-containing protein [Terriglobia bacterium]
MTILLDTSVIIDALRNRRGRRELLRSLLEQGHDLACCAINVAEVHSGVRPHEASATSEFIDSLGYIQISRAAARHAGQMRLEWQRKGRTLSLPDALIGAVALDEGLAVATDDVRDFSLLHVKMWPMPGV